MKMMTLEELVAACPQLKRNIERARLVQYWGEYLCNYDPDDPDGLEAMLKAALDYARRGWPVFPCSPATKQPLTPNGYKDATTDEAVIRRLWRRHPTAMIGVAMGKVSGVWCLDLDAPKKRKRPDGSEFWTPDGRESWNALLLSEQVTCPITHTHDTAGLGQHLVFRWRDDRPVSNSPGLLKGTGIDVRGEGGYIVVPPSVNAEGKMYHVAEPENFFKFADAPEVLYEQIAKKRTTQPDDLLTISQQAVALVKEPVGRFAEYADHNVHDRNKSYAEAALRKEADKLANTTLDRNIELNNAAFSLGGLVKAGALDAGKVTDALIAASVANGFDGEHGRKATEGTIKSGLTDAPLRKLPLSDSDCISALSIDGSEPADGAKKKPFEIFWHGVDYGRAARPWLAKTLIPEQGAGLMSGQWGTAKTFVAMDLAGCVMTGKPFAGREIDRPGGTLFIAAEGGGEVSIRLNAMVDKHGTDGALPFAWIEDTPDLKSDTSYRDLVEAAVGIGEQIKAKFSVDLVLIIVDTMSAAANWKDHNDAAEGQLVMNRLNELGRATGAFVLAVDHFGKDASTGTRGTSAKEAAADVVLATLADRDLNGQLSKTRMAVRKLRGGKTGEEFPFDLNVVPAGFGETTCTIGWRAAQGASDSGASSEKVRWPKGLRVFRTAMQAMVAEKGKSITPYGGEGPTVMAVALDVVRTEFTKAYPLDDFGGGDDRDQKAAKRAAFNRALKDARARELIVSREIGEVDLLWFSDG
jgi:hypothetical protein